ncbi:hypothetical protein [Ferdinandcohnia sp. SAFN-114]|uniref:hypothetical protein n=1 Tax=Ferdinandcohnia sp. SAFN-114 TaxID=3387275 RepID=UPI003F808D2D
MKAAEQLPEELISDEIITSSEIKYFFRRSYFMVDDNMYVELVALAAESRIRSDIEEELNCEVIDSTSRELYLDSSSVDFAMELRESGIIKEVYPLTEEQLNYLKINYKNDLFSITKDTISKLIKH